MNKYLVLIHAVLWAAAILAASLMHAPTGLWVQVLPCLATMAWLANRLARTRVRAC